MTDSIAPFLVSAGAAGTAIAALLWALRVTDGARGAIASWRQRLADAELKLSRADSIFGAHPGVVLVWEEGLSPSEAEWGAPRAYGSPLALASLLRFSGAAGASDPGVRILMGLSAFEAKDATGRPARLSYSLAQLRREGTPFSLTISTPAGVFVEIDGRTAGARAVVWITDSSVKGVAQSGGQGRLDIDPHLVVARDPATFLEILQNAPFLAWRVTDAGRLDWANRAYLDALDAKSFEQAVARNMLIDQPTADQTRRAMEGGEHLSELRHVVLGGKRRALRIVIIPVSGGAAGLAFDVTDAEEMREDFARHIASHDETLNHLAEGVAVFGPDKRMIFHNRAFAEMWDLDSGFLATRPAHAQWLDDAKTKNLLPPHANYSEWRAGELALYQNVSPLEPESWRLPDGRMLRVVRQRHPMGGILLVFSDITSEQTLRGQYNALLKVQQAALDKLHEAIVVFGADARLQLHNSAFLSMWGVEAEAMTEGADFERIAERCEPLFHDHGVWSEIKARITDPSPRARQEHRGEMRRSDGSIVVYLTRPLPNGATLLAFIDMTASRRVEEALRERAEALEAADRLKTEFVQNVSKQLRDPLQTIQGYTEMLARRMHGPLNDRQQGHIDSVVEAANNLGKLMDNVLDIALIESNAVDLVLSDVAIRPVLEEAARAAPSAKAAEIRISVECSPDIGFVRADEKRIRQILFNLVTNALRFTDPGGQITIGAERLQGMVHLWVSDTGRGMAFEDQAQAFDPFVTGDRRGAGLGLALVRSFAELHQGWVSLKSAPDEGTTVNVYLRTDELHLQAAE